jgi:hypothetical protein
MTDEQFALMARAERLEQENFQLKGRVEDLESLIKKLAEAIKNNDHITISSLINHANI